MLSTDFLVGVAVSADHRLRGDRLVSALSASQRAASVCVLPDYFWHNSACSGFHPPASVMKLLSPTQHRRLNEIIGFLLLSLGLVMLLSLVSYHTQDPSLDTAADFAPSQPGRLPGLLPRGSLLPDVRRRGVSVPAADLSALLEVDPSAKNWRPAASRSSGRSCSRWR